MKKKTSQEELDESKTWKELMQQTVHRVNIFASSIRPREALGGQGVSKGGWKGFLCAWSRMFSVAPLFARFPDCVSNAYRERSGKGPLKERAWVNHGAGQRLHYQAIRISTPWARRKLPLSIDFGFRPWDSWGGKGAIRLERRTYSNLRQFELTCTKNYSSSMHS